MDKEITLQLFIEGQWVDAAQIALLQNESQGVLAPVYIAYSTNWAIQHAGASGSQALATLLNVAGFDSNPSHNEACVAICKHCANSLPELAEYIRRDVLNLALGNKDNHARNTAFTRNM